MICASLGINGRNRKAVQHVEKDLVMCLDRFGSNKFCFCHQPIMTLVTISFVVFFLFLGVEVGYCIGIFVYLYFLIIQ